MEKHNFQSGHDYHHQPTQPTVLKIEGATKIEGSFGTLIVKDNPAFDGYGHLIPTRMNVMRFIQDFCKAYGCNGVGENWEPSEELILAEFDKFFKYNKS